MVFQKSKVMASNTTVDAGCLVEPYVPSGLLRRPVRPARDVPPEVAPSLSNGFKALAPSRRSDGLKRQSRKVLAATSPRAQQASGAYRSVTMSPLRAL